jgi:subtilisin family serine protease
MNKMINRKLILGLGFAVILASCSSTKNIHNVAVPEGSDIAVTIPAKKGKMTETEIQKWPQADVYTDSVPGMSLEKAYQFIADKKGTTVIVGVIDSGIDINHEDLKDNIWTNTDEISGNGKDDDNNGYIDDIHGWNFLGGEGNATPEQLEITRIYKKLNPKYNGKTESQIKNVDKEEFAYYQKVKKDFENRIEKANKQLKQAKGNLEYNKKVIKYLIDSNNEAIEKFNKKDYTLADLNTLPEAERSPILTQILGNDGNVDEIIKQLNDELNRIENVVIDHYTTQLNQHYNLDFNGRTTNDNAYDIKDVPYGNSFTIGSIEDEFHGTHVSGIAIATRNNGTGINGVAKNVKLLSVRTVPDGDEYDKDVSLAIRYAVDNGAKVINMSFGKSYSPDADWVYDAIKYAASKDVLLVHASGNDHKDIDKSDNFPTDAPDKVNEISDNVITVGAMTRHFDEDLIASFSNYGKLNVDVFAPGLEIYSTFPNNKYESSQGTSMAAPEVTGVAALVRSYYPQLSASQIKHILMNSGIKVDFEVKLPGGEGQIVPFSDLSVSGRVLNAYNALLMADQMVNGK